MGSKTDPSGPGRPRRVIPAVCSSYRLRLGLRAPMRMSRSLFISIEFLLRRLYSNGAIAALAVALDGTIRRQICLSLKSRSVLALCEAIDMIPLVVLHDRMTARGQHVAR